VLPRVPQCPPPASRSQPLSSCFVIPLLSVHADLAERGRLGYAGLTDSNQLEKREKGHDRFQPRPRVTKNGAEVEVWLMTQHLAKLLELVGERNLFHLDRDRPGRR